MAPTHDSTLAQAVATLIEGRYTSIRAAAKTYVVAKSTLRYRYRNQGFSVLMVSFVLHGKSRCAHLDKSKPNLICSFNTKENQKR
jgi:hypothetical protein